MTKEQLTLLAIENKLCNSLLSVQDAFEDCGVTKAATQCAQQVLANPEFSDTDNEVALVEAMIGVLKTRVIEMLS